MGLQVNPDVIVLLTGTLALLYRSLPRVQADDLVKTKRVASFRISDYSGCAVMCDGRFRASTG